MTSHTRLHVMDFLTQLDAESDWLEIGGKTPKQKAAEKRRKKRRKDEIKRRKSIKEKGKEKQKNVKPEPVDVSGGVQVVRTEDTKQTRENYTRKNTMEVMLNELRAMSENANVGQRHMENELLHVLDRPIKTTIVETLDEAMTGSLFIKELNMAHMEAEKTRHLYDMIQESWDADVLVESKGASVTAYMALEHFQITFLVAVEKKILALREAVAKREAVMSILIRAEKTKTLTEPMARRLKQSKKYMVYLKAQGIVYQELRKTIERSKESLRELLGNIITNAITFGSLEELQILNAYHDHVLKVGIQKLQADTDRHQDMVARVKVADKTKQAAIVLHQSKEKLKQAKEGFAVIQKTIKRITEAIQDRMTRVKAMSLAEKKDRRNRSRAIQEQPRYELRIKEFVELKRLIRIEYEESIHRDINDYLELLISKMYFALEPVNRSRIWANNKPINILLAVSNLRELESAISETTWIPFNQIPPLRQLYDVIRETLKKTYAPNVLVSSGIYMFMDKTGIRTDAGVKLGGLLVRSLWESTVNWLNIAAVRRYDSVTEQYDETAFNLIVYYIVMSYAMRQKIPWELIRLMTNKLVGVDQNPKNK